MKNFDWSKVTLEQLESVPRAVVTPFELGVFSIYFTGIECAYFCNAPNRWSLTSTHNDVAHARAVIACIDRIANCLTIHGGA